MTQRLWPARETSGGGRSIRVVKLGNGSPGFCHHTHASSIGSADNGAKRNSTSFNGASPAIPFSSARGRLTLSKKASASIKPCEIPNMPFRHVRCRYETGRSEEPQSNSSTYCEAPLQYP